MSSGTGRRALARSSQERGVGAQACASVSGVNAHLADLHDGISLDTSEKKRAYVVKTANGSYIRLSESAYQLLIWLDQGLTSEDIAGRLNQHGVNRVACAEVNARCQRLVARLGELAALRPKSASAGFTFRFCLIPAPLVRKISSRLTGAFRTQSLVLSAAVILWAALRTSTYHLRAADTAGNIAPALMLALFSLLIHEFGHAAACARFGAEPNEIGAGAYLLYPAFYSNVSDAWRLTRWQRVTVDLGGIYFQALTAAAFVGMYEITGWRPFRASLFLIVGSFLFTLNPFFKFDGYWVISDALGVTNLRDQWRTLMTFAFHHFRHRPARPLPWPRHIAAAVVVCSICSCTLWFRFVLNVGPVLWASVHSYTISVTQAALLIIHDPSAFTVRHALGLAGQTYLFACTLTIAWQCGARLRTWSSRMLSAIRPLRRPH